jgi:hypothetical protein
VVDLVLPAAQALVGAMTTSAWEDARAKLAEFFRSHKGQAGLEGELDASYARLKASPSQRHNEAAKWAVLLKAIAEASPEAAAGVGLLAAQLAQLTAPIQDARIQQTGIAGRDQYNVGGSLTIQRG